VPIEGKNAVVTGGGRGIGAACARALARAGAAVVVAARTRAQVEAVAADLCADGRDVQALTVDVADPASVEALRAGAEAALGGPVDILVNNAGIAHSAPIRALALEDWNRLLAVNATGTFLCTKAFLGGMIGRKWGRVVNVASIAARAGAAYIAGYAASKHAVLGFTRCAAVEVAKDGITVNAVCPGYVDTEMTRESLARIAQKTGLPEAKALESILAQTPQRRLIRAEEVADLVLWLCGDAAAGVNGQGICMDGGGVLA